jgi:hypothetical protein
MSTHRARLRKGQRASALLAEDFRGDAAGYLGEGPRAVSGKSGWPFLRQAPADVDRITIAGRITSLGSLTHDSPSPCAKKTKYYGYNADCVASAAGLVCPMEEDAGMFTLARWAAGVNSSTPRTFA